jgi:hypothetical protein
MKQHQASPDALVCNFASLNRLPSHSLVIKSELHATRPHAQSTLRAHSPKQTLTNVEFHLNQGKYYVLWTVNDSCKTASIKINNKQRNVSFVSMSKTIRPIASFMSTQHVVFDAQIHYSQNCFDDMRHMKMAAHTCLIREIQITTLATYTADMRRQKQNVMRKKK